MIICEACVICEGGLHLQQLQLPWSTAHLATNHHDSAWTGGYLLGLHYCWRGMHTGTGHKYRPGHPLKTPSKRHFWGPQAASRAAQWTGSCTVHRPTPRSHPHSRKPNHAAIPTHQCIRPQRRLVLHERHMVREHAFDGRGEGQVQGGEEGHGAGGGGGTPSPPPPPPVVAPPEGPAAAPTPSKSANLPPSRARKPPLASPPMRARSWPLKT